MFMYRMDAHAGRKTEIARVEYHTWRGICHRTLLHIHESNISRIR